ncbi:MAG: hypothetical protein CM1200mP2_00670 [Planctomycetaceae bacterium]|nr:MAG: hypothetical protein CM1200mP2_00670 [Planctomycetaceae bacterium]
MGDAGRQALIEFVGDDDKVEKRAESLVVEDDEEAAVDEESADEEPADEGVLLTKSLLTKKKADGRKGSGGRSRGRGGEWAGEGRTTRSRSPRIVRIVDSRSKAIGLAESADALVEFDFCAAMRVLCEDIADRVPTLSHVRMGEVAVCVTRARRGGRTGLWAKLTPMRFEGGASVGLRQGRRYRIEPLILGGHERLYILTFCLPRFLDLTYREKLETVFLRAVPRRAWFRR